MGALARAPGSYRFATGLLLGSGATATAVAVQSKAATDDEQEVSTAQVGWVRKLAEQDGVEEVASIGKMIRSHPVGQLVTERDHLFDAMARSKQILEFRCFYDTVESRYHSVVQLGREVCGYPQTTHGGLTAAIMDETLGGLYGSLLVDGKLGSRFPAYTARLEVDYKAKVPRGALLLCSTHLESVEDRKIWMRAVMTDGQGTTYATARALFVCPKMDVAVRNAMAGWLKGSGERTSEAVAATATAAGRN